MSSLIIVFVEEEHQKIKQWSRVCSISSSPTSSNDIKETVESKLMILDYCSYCNSCFRSEKGMHACVRIKMVKLDWL